MNFEMHFENIEKYTEKSKKNYCPMTGVPSWGYHRLAEETKNVNLSVYNILDTVCIINLIDTTP